MNCGENFPHAEGAMAVSYNLYNVTYSGGVYTLDTTAGPAVRSISDTDSSNDHGILGSVADDTFKISLSGDTYRYIGTASYTSAFDGTVNAFVAEDTTTGKYYLFSPNKILFGLGEQPKNDQKLTVTTPTGHNGVGDWDIATGAPGCFTAGTMIATPDGERAVESLAAGDLVLTADGRAAPVRWLGQSVVSRVFADPLRILPVRIKAGALGENVPARDLLVSSGHAMYVGDVLAHAGALVNGDSIVREQDMPLVFTYYHLELDTHALLLANGAPAESFIDGVEAMDFSNWAERPASTGEEMAHPRAKSARQLPRAVREHLAARAAALTDGIAKAA
jgi:hypothetical protein